MPIGRDGLDSKLENGMFPLNVVVTIELIASTEATTPRHVEEWYARTRLRWWWSLTLVTESE